MSRRRSGTAQDGSGSACRRSNLGPTLVSEPRDIAGAWTLALGDAHHRCDGPLDDDGFVLVEENRADGLTSTFAEVPAAVID